ncbi:MAG: hydrogenase [Anaerolineae bacterium]|nr:hydrogenase [Anaerolineae bacterium]MCB9130041.1 hydrogenase [Anaerolineales bacterium]MCB0236089.1 hydrogenase [Anaerolineae bacterium]MCB0241291.1 hydrogenase [Anaerolineae bacterium]MCB0244374.1 hydrogenase [Anaerolineae bacterium]
MILIIAYGNPLREDDGAGLALAYKLDAALRHPGLVTRRIETQQLLPELAADIASDQTQAVVFADARVALSPDEQVTVTSLTSSRAASPSLGHHLDPEALLTYAGALYYRTIPPAWLVTVPGWRFGFGETLSAQTQDAISIALNDPESQLQWLVADLHRLHGMP